MKFLNKLINYYRAIYSQNCQLCDYENATKEDVKPEMTEPNDVREQEK